MGQKVDPRAIRLGINRDWDSNWYAGKENYAEYLLEDNKIRKFLRKELLKAGVARIFIARRTNEVIIDVYVARPGMVIGKGGSEAELVKKKLVALAGGKNIVLNIKEVQNPSIDPYLLAESVAQQIEKRIPFKRPMKQIITRALRAGARGIKVKVGGRLNGSEIARSEWYREGRVPLHTLRADIDYGFAEAATTYGKIGIKVWIYKGDILDKNSAGEVKLEDVTFREEIENVNA